MKNRSRKACIDLGKRFEKLCEVVDSACSARCNDRYAYRIAHGIKHFKVKSALNTIGINGVKHNFARSVSDTSFYPFDRFKSCILTAALCKNTKHSVDPFYVSRVLKEKKGQTLRQYIISHRLKLSLKLLEATDKSVAEIAGECGFTDASYFTKTFRQNFGMTPKDYRNQYKQDFI